MVMSQTHVNQRVQKHRNALRAAGFRPVQIWLPDTRREGFLEECRRQSVLVAQAEADGVEMDHLSKDALNDIEGWNE
nr:antitoxin MazE family protein [Oceanococcus sp. HetDA_MAG_MS8]